MPTSYMLRRKWCLPRDDHLGAHRAVMPLSSSCTAARVRAVYRPVVQGDSAKAAQILEQNKEVERISG